MPITDIVVIGAAGDIGRGAVAAALARGWSVVASGRRADALDDLAASYSGAPLTTLVGSVATDGDAEELAAKLTLDRPVGVVNAISLKWASRSLLDTPYHTIADYFESYLGAHLATARAFVPRLPAGSVLLGIGGGMADFVLAAHVPTSMMQAAHRMMYRGLHKEMKGSGIAIRELIVISKVHGHSNRGEGRPEWLTDAEIGARICDLLEHPDSEDNVGPIVAMAPAH